MGVPRVARAVATSVLVCAACASSTIDDGFTATAGVFSTTVMGEGSSGEDPPTGATMSASSTSMPGDTDDPSATVTTDPTDADTDDPSATGETTDDPSATGETTDDPTDTTGPMPVCGDGVVEGAEACDDGNALATDACLPGCVPAACGDGALHAGVEVCDDGVNDGTYGGCAPGCAALAPFCGDGAITDGEMCDSQIALPYANISCGACVYDFSALPQLYCNGSCTWAGSDGCDQADADIYCRLVTGDPASTATSYSVVAALDEPGFSCPGYGVDLGAFPGFGVNQQVWYQDTSIVANHGGGSVIANAVCS